MANSKLGSEEYLFLTNSNSTHLADYQTVSAAHQCAKTKGKCKDIGSLFKRIMVATGMKGRKPKVISGQS